MPQQRTYGGDALTAPTCPHTATSSRRRANYDVKRREFITLLGGAAAWPLAARAQQPAMPVIGFLDIRSPNTMIEERLRAFRQGLKDTGYVERENVAIEYRWAENQVDRLPELAAELVRRQVAAFVTTGGPAGLLAAKAATTTIPIVFVVAEDPVRLGFVASLARPGGNATGINIFTIELAAKRLELLRELVPGAARMAVLVTAASAETTVRDVEAASRAAGESNWAQLAAFHRLPATYALRDYAEAGGLMSYGPNITDAFRQLGVQQFVVENRPGAGGNLATEAVVRSPPDGYTLLLVNSSNTINATLYDKLNFDFIRDIASISEIARFSFVMEVNPSVPTKTLPEFIAYAKANPGKINMASAGSGSTHHVAGELFKMMAGVEMVHVPYRGSPPALTDLLAGQVQVMFDATPSSLPHIRAGKLRPLAVTTATRLEVLPDIPTVGDFVPGYEASSWLGFGAPKNTPAAVVDRLNKEINLAISDSAIKARLVALGGLVLPPSSPAEFGKFLTSDTEKWARVIRTANIKPE